MPSYRVRGQEVSVQVVQDGKIVAELNDVKSFDVEFQMDVMKEGYLGEFTDRRDDMFKGISGKIEFHIENNAPFDFINAVVQRSQSRVKGTQFNVQSTVNLPNGQVKRLLVNDIFFSSIPVNVSGRSDYVTYSLPYEAAEGKFL
jgi:hypothetical protein